MEATAPLVSLSGICIGFGSVQVLENADLVVAPGECLGLVGHNGAGKSTLMNVLAGVLTPQKGKIAIDGKTLAHRHSIGAAQRLGIRTVFQELSLCPNLSVVENLRITHPDLVGRGWRKRAARLIMDRLDAIFPGHEIHPDELVQDLSIGSRQKVEIARAFTRGSLPLRVAILDEPTSALDALAAASMLHFVRSQASAGMGLILISHLLGEILQVCDRVLVMRDGAVVADRPTATLDRESLVAAMGHVTKTATAARAKTGTKAVAPCIEIAQRARDRSFIARPGEIVGLAGLSGQGQKRLLLDIAGGRPDVRVQGRFSFVAGDRQIDGIFPAWSIGENTTACSLTQLRRFGLISLRAEHDLAQIWRRRLGIVGPGNEVNIRHLSGGNQQKVLFARALAAGADIILMDDPMRGVDVGTKAEVYELIRDEAAHGRCFIWYSTEIGELDYCDRVYVFRNGGIVAELVGAEINEARILGASFHP